MKKFKLTTIVLLVLSVCASINAQIDSTKIKVDQIESSLKYQTGTIEFPACNAKLRVPDGFRYLDSKQSVFVLSTLWGNPADSSILGLLVPANRGVLEPNS